MTLDDYPRHNDQTATLAAVSVAGLTVLLTALRRAIRVVRERREDRADLLAGAAWRAQHMPHLMPAAPPTTASAAATTSRAAS